MGKNVTKINELIESLLLAQTCAEFFNTQGIQIDYRVSESQMKKKVACDVGEITLDSHHPMPKFEFDTYPKLGRSSLFFMNGFKESFRFPLSGFATFLQKSLCVANWALLSGLKERKRGEKMNHIPCVFITKSTEIGLGHVHPKKSAMKLRIF